MKTILITRPEEEAGNLAHILATRGFDSFIEPLLSIERAAKGDPALKAALARSPQAILITSKRALDIILKLPELRPTPLVCVGKATAGYARQMGFKSIRHCETAQLMPGFVKEHFSAPARLLYARAHDISVDIAAILEKAGYIVDSVILYKAVPATSFSDRLRASLSAGSLAGALFFSRRTADAYTMLAKAHGLEEAHRALWSGSMSDAIADGLRDLPWGRVIVSARPDLPHLLDAIPPA